uniref:Endonuclease/exonuclease/phosphatase domain-containing protein n=1 Tax=Sinocyclocheilus rhinocerous TaxID=307959 RepID=A0A673LWL3_9TELE
MQQEAHLTIEESKKITAGWISQYFHSTFNSIKRGVSILIRKGISFSHKTTITDPDGCFTIINGYIGKYSITIANIYGPNTDKPSFFHSVFVELSNFPNASIILGGNFNTVLNPQLDRSNIGIKYKTNNSSATITQYMEDYGLKDVWRLHIH